VRFTYARKVQSLPETIVDSSRRVYTGATFSFCSSRMTPEKILLHQVHPVKLAADIIAAVVSLYFFWQHQLVVGLVTHLVPPVVASAAVLHFADLAPYKNSRLGVYLERYMTLAVQASGSLGI